MDKIENQSSILIKKQTMIKKNTRDIKDVYIFEKKVIWLTIGSWSLKQSSRLSYNTFKL